jgi:hypothetical protein
MWSVSASRRKAFPAPSLNTVSMNLISTAVHWTATRAPRLFFWGGGAQQKLRTHRSLKASVMKMRERPFFSQVMGKRWNEADRGKPKYLGGKPVPVPLCPPQIPRGLTGDRTRASAVGGRRLTAWAMARPSHPDLRQTGTAANVTLPAVTPSGLNEGRREL